jgi:hypothetical protein
VGTMHAATEVLTFSMTDMERLIGPARKVVGRKMTGRNAEGEHQSLALRSGSPAWKRLEHP